MSTGSTLNQRSGKPVKLRASCDFCALSKVKCDRGQPQCVRCIKSGIDCNYSESRRIGKAWHHCAPSAVRSTSATTQGTRRKQQTIAQHSPRRRIHRDTQALSAADDAMSPYDPSGYATPFSMFHTLPSPVPESTIRSQTHIESYPSLDGTMAPILCSPESADISLPDIPHVAQLRTNELEGESPSVLQYNPSWDRIMAEHSTAIGDAGDCITRAAAVLKSVRDPRTSCVRSRTPPRSHTQSLDATLDDGRTAMDTVKDILACPCAQEIRVALLLVLIIQQVLESYQALLTQQHDTPREESPLGINLSGYDTPMAIGRYLLDNELRSKIIVQVLSSELEKIGLILDILTRHAQSMAHQPDELILGTYIDSLQTTKKEVLESLEQGNDI
ncbi:hypothetical protein AO1008_08538 [Aspergillus oryzae 100-8]|uniref:Zn(2)-C6 fungal-type domain-containing protein n=1 Tax=Aspergillus oryzae (strain 3.042) TaxID=1160506 RepID=I8U6A3_ASPO3|nr:hypothetical protein Ao3042_00428 [Aspergillus oryzae 3.042]KDE81891.1 hypothetical protein AO1008_08538 [Aspergillus oryzae 100-8]|eukprot:EIT82440.1 hypothetical protein Ao3042_00428 [Aspergillus oryzae 3.042]